MSDPVSSPQPAIPRPAASLLVLREGPAGPEVLMGLRGAGHRFMPNHLVFPGGAVDPEDHAAPVATELPPSVLGRLRRSAEGTLAAALGVAAARELEEETGLSLGVPPALDGLDYLCRAITPAVSPVRFDARFFVVAASRVHGTIAGSGELEGLRWYGLSEAEALDIAFATRNVLARLRDWMTMDEASRNAPDRPVPVLGDRLWRLE